MRFVMTLLLRRHEPSTPLGAWPHKVEVKFDRSMGTIHRYDFTIEVDGKVAVIGAVAVSLSGSQS